MRRPLEASAVRHQLRSTGVKTAAPLQSEARSELDADQRRDDTNSNFSSYNTNNNNSNNSSNNINNNNHCSNKRQDEQQHARPPKQTPIRLGLLIHVVFSIVLLFDATTCDSAPVAKLGATEASRMPVDVRRQRVAKATTQPTPPADIPQRFNSTPKPLQQVDAGLTILLRCTVDHLQGSGQWSRDRDVIYDQTDERYKDQKKYVMVGNETEGDFSLEIRNAEPRDTAQYTCLIRPGADDPDELRYPTLQASTNVTVRPHSPPPPPPPVSQQLLQDQLVSSAAPADSKQTRDLPHLPQLVRPPQAHQQPLQTLNYISAQHQASLALPAPTGASASANALGSTHHSPSHPGPWPHHLLLFWPYLLLGLAALLFMANIYLICSLFRRVKSRQSAASNGGSVPTTPRKHIP